MSVRIRKQDKLTIDPNKLSELLTSSTDDPREKLKARIRASRMTRLGANNMKKMEQIQQDKDTTLDTPNNQTIRNRNKRRRKKLKQMEDKLGTISEERYIEALDKIRMGSLSNDILSYEQKVIDIYNRQHNLDKQPDWETEFA